MGKQFLNILLLTIAPRFLNYDPKYWISVTLFIAILLYAWLRSNYGKRLRQILNAFFTSRMNQLDREESAVSNRVSVALFFLFILIISLFFYQIFDFGVAVKKESFSFFYDTSGILLYVQLCLLISVLYFFKIGLIYFLGYLFKAENAASEYVFNIFLFNEILGLFLLPVTITMSFLKLLPAEALIYSGLLIIMIVFAYRIFRSVTGNQNQNISKYYLFLYLCTLEIMPLVVILKVFVG